MLVCRAGRRRFRQKRLREFLSRVCGALGLAQGCFDVTLVGDRAMRSLNARFRGKDATTDVLSFPLLERVTQGLRAGKGARAVVAARTRTGHGAVPSEISFIGDVVISVPAAERNARREGWPLEIELPQLALHGVLHLLGYDHETDEGHMTRRELALRRRLGITGETEAPPRRCNRPTPRAGAAATARGGRDRRGKN